MNPLSRALVALSPGYDPLAVTKAASNWEAVKQQLQHQQEGMAADRAKAGGTIAVAFLERIAQADPETRKVMAQVGGDLIKPMLATLGYDLPPTLISAMAETPGMATKVGTFITSRLGQKRALELQPLVAGMKDPKQIAALVDDEVERGVKASLPTVQTRVAQWVKAVRANAGISKSHGLVDEKGNLLPIPGQMLVDSVDVLFSDPLERAAAARLLTDKNAAGFFAGLGIEPGEVQLGGLETFRKKQAEEATEGGQATIANTRARTELTKTQTATEPYKVVPGQGGALIRLPGVGTPAAPGAPASTGVAPQAGLQVAPGATVIAQTPAAGLPVETAREIATHEQSIADLQQIGRILSTGKADTYIGPTLTGARFKEWATKNLPGWLVGRVPDALALLDFSETQFKNFRIRAITGAAVRESEEPRILAETPDRTRDKPEVYRKKWQQSVANMRVLTDRLKELVGPDGKMKAGVDPVEVARRHPLLPPIKDTGVAPSSSTAPRVKSLKRIE